MLLLLITWPGLQIKLYHRYVRVCIRRIVVYIGFCICSYRGSCNIAPVDKGGLLLPIVFVQSPVDEHLDGSHL